MKLATFFVAVRMNASLRAEPTVSTLEWISTCDGAVIEVARDGATILGIQASAYASTAILEWSLHYLAGAPVSAEYRYTERGRISNGEKAGDYSGENPLKKIHCWKWDGTQFPIEDAKLKAELLDLLAKVKTEMEKS